MSEPMVEIPLARAQEMRDAIFEMRCVLEELLGYTDRHRVSNQAPCCDGHCFEEWCVLRDEVRRVLDSGRSTDV